MFDSNYKPAAEGAWSGRVDSASDFEAFRWHQWVKGIDLNEEGLASFEGKLGIAFLGYCSDEGIKVNKGRTGAAKGPDSIRRELANLPCSFTREVQLFDAGNIFSENCTVEESQELLSKAVEKLMGLNLFPVVLGGGHEIAFGHFGGILNHMAKNQEVPKIGIINFDAHFDLRPYSDGGSSGSAFRQIADLTTDRGQHYSYFCIGIQRHSNTISLFKAARELNVDYILAKDIMPSGDWSAFEGLDDFLNLQDHIYITICSDVFSSAYAPGVSAVQPLGLDPEIVLKLIKYIVKSKKVVSFDIAEVSPRFDQDNITASLASVLIFALVNSLARLQGAFVES
jgi:formiminoglutamase